GLAVSVPDERDDPQGAAGAVLDLHGEGDYEGAFGGEPVEVGQVLEAGDVGRGGDAVDEEVLRRAVIDVGQ
ncbi:MAG TPA: hypothetical protein VHG91_11720, partial [Longimicrobium sp.]|nr:hypothetical protein [Longimicrobium sp.]